MTGDQNPAPGPAPGVPIKVTPEILLQVLTTPPASGPAPFPAVPVDLPAPADIANGALFAAGNSGVPGDVESSGLEDLDRRAHAADAVQKFSANEADAAQQFQGVGAQAEAQGATQMMRGTPSRGVWQFIAPTFAAYHEPGTSTNIHDLVAQACAFINYARGHYGVAADASNLADLIQQADPRRSPRGY